MQKIPLKLATSGMVVAREVFRNDNPVGMPVCGKDTVLSEALITRLENLDVASLYVEGHPVWEAGDRSLDELLCDLDNRFVKVRLDPLTEKLHDIYVDYLKRSMGDHCAKCAK